jgi:Integrase core domain
MRTRRAWRRPVEPGQYTSFAFGKRCREMGVVSSVGSVGDAYDNAMAESFFATLECELLVRRCFRTQAEAKLAVFEYVEGSYNPRRRHASLGYRSPVAFERALMGQSSVQRFNGMARLPPAGRLHEHQMLGKIDWGDGTVAAPLAIAALGASNAVGFSRVNGRSQSASLNAHRLRFVEERSMIHGGGRPQKINVS